MDSDSSLSDPPSDLSSPDLSPSLRYPSPHSSQDQDAATDGASEAKKRKLNDGEQNTAVKKRKRAEPKPRTTERLDFSNQTRKSSEEQDCQLNLLMKVLRKRRKIVVVAGAGISVSAGIPDFRSSNGLFKTLRDEHKLKASGKQLFDASVYQNDKSTGAFHDMVRNLSGLVSTAKPTPFHQMLATLGQEGRLLRLYTQNVDGIDVALPSLETNVPLNQKGPWPRSIQLHGGLEKMVCSKCHGLSEFEPELFNGPVPPACPKCIEADKIRTDHAGKRSHGIGRLRPRMVLYNEHNPDEEAIGACMASDLRARPDAIIVVGTSMKIPGVRRVVKEMCGVVRSRRDGLAVWINQDAPPTGPYFENCWDLIVKGPCDEVARQWNVSLNPHMECSTADIERARDGTNVEVLVKSPQKSRRIGLPTPAPSPVPKSQSDFSVFVKSEVDGETDATIAKPTLGKPQRQGPPKAVRKPKKTSAKSAKGKLDSKSEDVAKPNSTITKVFAVTKKGRPSNKASKLSISTSNHVLQPTDPTAARSNGPPPEVLTSKAPLSMELRFKTTFNSQKKENVASHAADSSSDLSFDSSLESIPISCFDNSFQLAQQSAQTMKDSGSQSKFGQMPKETVSPKSIPKGMHALLNH